MRITSAHWATGAAVGCGADSPVEAGEEEGEPFSAGWIVGMVLPSTVFVGVPIAVEAGGNGGSNSAVDMAGGLEVGELQPNSHAPRRSVTLSRRQRPKRLMTHMVN